MPLTVTLDIKSDRLIIIHPLTSRIETLPILSIVSSCCCSRSPSINSLYILGSLHRVTALACTGPLARHLIAHLLFLCYCVSSGEVLLQIRNWGLDVFYRLLQVLFGFCTNYIIRIRRFITSITSAYPATIDSGTTPGRPFYCFLYFSLLIFVVLCIHILIIFLRIMSAIF